MRSRTVPCQSNVVPARKAMIDEKNRKIPKALIPLGEFVRTTISIGSKRTADVFLTSAAFCRGFSNKPRTYKSGPRYSFKLCLQRPLPFTTFFLFYFFDFQPPSAMLIPSARSTRTERGFACRTTTLNRTSYPMATVIPPIVPPAPTTSGTEMNPAGFPNAGAPPTVSMRKNPPDRALTPTRSGWPGTPGRDRRWARSGFKSR